MLAFQCIYEFIIQGWLEKYPTLDSFVCYSLFILSFLPTSHHYIAPHALMMTESTSLSCLVLMFHSFDSRINSGVIIIIFLPPSSVHFSLPFRNLFTISHYTNRLRITVQTITSPTYFSLRDSLKLVSLIRVTLFVDL